MDLFNKEIKYVETYENKSNFSLLEAKSDWLVYRSEVSSHTTKEQPNLIPTVDLVFIEAMYFELLNHFKGIKITKQNDFKSLELAKKYDKGFEYLESSERVLMIESQGSCLYVVAAHLWIHEHNFQCRNHFFEEFNYNSYLRNTVKSWIKLK